MSAQNIFQSGQDISADISVSTSEIQQMVNNLKPVSNIGVVYVSTTRPDITNNPIFINFIWLDITDPTNPVFKRYKADRTVLVDADASWTTVAVSAGAITNAMIADYAVSVLNSSGNKKIAYKHDASADASKALWLLRVDSAGQYVEAVNLSSVLTANSVPLSALDKAGAADNQVLSYLGGVLAFRAISADLFGAATIPLSKLATATALYILRVNAGGTSWEAVNTNAFLQDGDVGISKLAAGAATALQNIRRNAGNTAWEYATPIFSKESGALLDGSTVFARAGTAWNVAHGLGITPKLVRITARCNTNDATPGYIVGDIVEDQSFINSANNIPIAVLGVDATNILLGTTADITYSMIPKAGGNRVAVTEANWNWNVYAYA